MKPKSTAAGFVTDLLAMSAAPAPAAAAGEGRSPQPAPDEATIKFSSRLTEPNNLALERVAYWMPGSGKIQKIINQALAAYFSAHPDAHRPTPDE